ncbi:MAG: VWA domain-containing protein, partial [Cellvibrionaceae bacterium]|nr:VWA domain-containing protein [Cellvibrionaceae bacterium]
MFEFIWPWVFLLLPLPLLALRLLPRADAQGAALMVPFYQQLAGAEQEQRRHSWFKFILLSIAWLALLSAAARPMWIGEPVQLPSSGRDLLLAVDISGSMKQVDMEIKGERFTRLQAVKAVVGDFVQRRQNDRLGLVLFGSRAYLQAPLTFDRPTVGQLLAEAETGFAGEKTAIGDAIGLAIKRLRQRPAESRVLILLTDGANTAGEVSPLQAAELAAQTQVKIYTIGVGAEEMQVSSMFGLMNRTVNPSADLDEETLKTIASK